jgi:hypothetical protein
VAEGGHEGGGCEAEGDQIHSPLPGPYISDILGSRKVEDVVQELIIGLDAVRGDLESQELHLQLSNLEFGRVESAATLAANFKELTDVKEVLLNVVIVDDAVVHAGLLVASEAGHDVRFPVTVSIPSTEQALR